MTAQELIGMIDPTITLGNIIEIGSIIGGGLLVLIKLNNSVVGLKTDVATMQEEIKKIGDVLIQLAVTGTRLTNVEADIREMRADVRRGHE